MKNKDNIFWFGIIGVNLLILGFAVFTLLNGMMKRNAMFSEVQDKEKAIRELVKDKNLPANKWIGVVKENIEEKKKMYNEILSKYQQMYKTYKEWFPNIRVKDTDQGFPAEFRSTYSEKMKELKDKYIAATYPNKCTKLTFSEKKESDSVLRSMDLEATSTEEYCGLCIETDEIKDNIDDLQELRKFLIKYRFRKFIIDIVCSDNQLQNAEITISKIRFGKFDKEKKYTDDKKGYVSSAFINYLGEVIPYELTIKIDYVLLPLFLRQMLGYRENAEPNILPNFIHVITGVSVEVDEPLEETITIQIPSYLTEKEREKRLIEEKKTNPRRFFHPVVVSISGEILMFDDSDNSRAKKALEDAELVWKQKLGKKEEKEKK